MKKLITYLVLISIGLILFGCDKPAPTELIDDSIGDFAEYEVLGKDFNDEYYSNGGDTTGVTQDLKEFPNLISISGIKLTDINRRTDGHSFAQSIFFDRTKPVFDSHDRLLGYHTVTPGTVWIDNSRAREVPFIIRYRDNGVLMDTTLGDKYILFSGLHQFHYRHNSQMNFRLDFFGNNISFDIPTPTEITGNVEIMGKRSNGDLKALL